MPKTTLDKETLQKNKAVDQRLLEQAERHKRDLAKLGRKRPQGYRLTHPLDSRLVRRADPDQPRSQTQV